MKRFRFTLKKNQKGQAAVEYILLLAMVGVFTIFLTTRLLGIFTSGMDYLSINLGKRLNTGVCFDRAGATSGTPTRQCP